MKHLLCCAVMSVFLFTACSGSGRSKSSDADKEVDSVSTISEPGGEPDGVTVTEGGDIFITDIESGEVKQVTAEGESILITDLGEQSHPDGVTSVIEGDSTILYITDTGSADDQSATYPTDGTIDKVAIDSSGTVAVSEFIDSSVIDNPTGIAADSEGNLYVADQGSGDVYKITVNDGVAGTPVSLTDNGTSDPGVSVEEPHGLALVNNDDGSITLYTTDQAADSNNIVQIHIPASGDASGAVISNVTEKNTGGADGDTVDTAEFNKPHGIAADKEGALFVTDENNNRVQIITPGGKVVTFAGVGTSGDVDGDADQSQFSDPRGIAVDNDGNVLVCDCGNGKVKKISR